LTYLICDKCGSYYELQPGESPDDFDLTCDCGGELKYYYSFDDYHNDNNASKSVRTGRGSLKSKFLLIIIILLIGIVLAYSWANINNHSNSMGSDSKGSVTKEVYSHPGYSGPKIAIITGMHPREISAKNVLPDVIKSYAATHNVEIVNYQINVTQDPQDFTIGRENGQDLVAQYVIPDIAKSNYSMVIIVHNHEQGYGDGYYIATPSMDAKSVALGQSVHGILPDFNYYTRNTDQAPEGTSINQVNNPIVATKTPVFVYEIPEWLGNSDVATKSNRLIDAVFKVI
jgi:hypothetical protein